MVSTDDTKIAEVAKNTDAEVPFFRSTTKSNDFATIAEVLEELLTQYRKNNKEFICGCCIYSTESLITPDKLKRAFEMLKLKQTDSIIPIN